MTGKEITVQAGGLALAVKTWGDASSPPVIALHGWLDNAASFDNLAPLLPGYYWVVPDLPGHGRSGHRGAGAEYTIWSYCVEVMALADALGFETFILVGHSMGGAVAGLIAALYPERVMRMVLLDSLGPITTAPASGPEQMLKALEQRRKPLRNPGIYPSEADAVQARARKGVTVASAGLLGKRGIDSNEAGFFWNHDQRLTNVNLLSMTEAQVDEFLRAIACPVLLITSAWSEERSRRTIDRTALVGDIRVESLPGGHHQHMEGEAAVIGELVGDFLARGTG